MGFDEHDTSSHRVFDPEGGVTRRSVHVTFDERLLPFRKRVSIAEEQDGGAQGGAQQAQHGGAQDGAQGQQHQGQQQQQQRSQEGAQGLQ